MPGSRAGGVKAAATNLARNPNFYKEIDRRGGLVKTPTGGFASLSPEVHKIISAKGGRTSRKRNNGK